LDESQYLACQQNVAHANLFWRPYQGFTMVAEYFEKKGMLTCWNGG
jgi:hypothetical protein